MSAVESSSAAVDGASEGGCWCKGCSLGSKVVNDQDTFIASHYSEQNEILLC